MLWQTGLASSDNIGGSKVSNTLRVLGLFEHNGLSRSQRSSPSGERVFGPYRVDLLMDNDVDLHTISMAKLRFHKKVRDLVEHRTGVRVDLALRGVFAAFRADLVLSILEDKSVLPSLFRQFRVRPYSARPLSVISCWWAEELVNGGRDLQSKIRRALVGVSQIIVFSRNQTEIFAAAGFGDQVVPVTFGVDHEYFRPEPCPGPGFQVFSAGVDRGRDFETLVTAARLLPEVRFDIFTQMDILGGTHAPPNLTVHPPTDGEGHRKNLALRS